MAELAAKQISASPVKCSSCYAPLKVSPNHEEISHTDLVCEYCGATTRFDDARNWADDVNRWLERRFGERGGEIMEGGADVTLRSYVFQKDIVDYLAARFLTTAKFLNPVLSSPDAVSSASLRDEMEYGLELEEYLSGLALDAAIPEHTEIRALAGTPVDLQEANRQAYKLRALTYFARGLVVLQRAAELNVAGAMAPSALRGFENSEVLFEGSLKSCLGGGESFPDDSFFEAFGLFTLGSVTFLRAVRLHSMGYAFDSTLEEARQAFESISRRGPIALDQSRKSGVFADPSKAKLRAQIESKFGSAASGNLSRVSRYQTEVRSFPDQVQSVSNRLRFILIEYLKSKVLSFKLGLCFLGTLVAFSGVVAAAAASPLTFFSPFPSGGLAALTVLGGLGVVFGALIRRQGDRRGSLSAQYRDVARRDANPLFIRVSLLTSNSANVVSHYLTPWEMLHDLFTGEVLPLGWLLRRGLVPSLIRRVHSVPPVSNAIDRPPPAAVAEPTKDRPDEEYHAYYGVVSVYAQLRFPFFT